MAKLQLKGIYKEYENGYTAVKDFNLDIADKEFIVFVGPSGCGKSTTLRMIAGLEDISRGELYIDDKLVNDVSAKDRDIAMVFQSYALYPHMSVFDNMAFGLKLRKLPKNEIEEKVRHAAKILDIEHLLDRKPKALSGGQRQRVAMGRAIVRNPKVFLMDEPLSNLDAKLRVQMRAEISKLHNQLETTFIYVTHDQTEAMTLGTRIVVMKDGIVQQVDSPSKIYERPNNVFVATFIGSPQMNLLYGDVIREGSEVLVKVYDKKIKVTKEQEEVLRNKKDLKELIVGVRPEDIKISEKSNETIEAKIEVIENLGAEAILYAKLSDRTISFKTSEIGNLKIGDIINITLNNNKLHIFDKENQNNILA